MKRPYLLLITVLVLTGLSSCSVSKNSPTPDDVYYSPNTPVKITSTGTTDNSEYYSTPNDNYVKMRVQNPDKWSYFDDYNYDYYGGYSPYGYSSGFGMSVGLGFGAGFYSPFYGGFGYYSPMSYYNSYYAWNSFYNPYYGGVIVINGKNTTTPSYTRLSNFNPSSYQGNYYNTRPGLHGTSLSHYNQPYSNSNPNSNFNRSTDSRPTFSSPMRSSPSNFSSGGGGGGGMRGGGGSRPGR
jgi:hypothetical protein